MNRKAIGNYFFIFTLSLGLYVLLIPFGIIGIDYRTLIGFFAYFALTVFMLKKYRGEVRGIVIMVLIVLAQCLLPLPVIVKYFDGQVWSLPLIVSFVAGSLTGFLFVKISTPANFLVAYVLSVASFGLFFSGWDLWINRVNFGTFNGRIPAYSIPERFEATNLEKDILREEDVQNKITLMDFWTTTCGACFEKFPLVEAAYKKYADDKDVNILAVNTPVEEDGPNQAFEVIQDHGYAFPVVVLREDSMAKEIGIDSYPTTLVLDRNARIVYKGHVEGAVRMVEELRANRQTAGLR